MKRTAEKSWSASQSSSQLKYSTPAKEHTAEQAKAKLKLKIAPAMRARGGNADWMLDIVLAESAGPDAEGAEAGEALQRRQIVLRACIEPVWRRSKSKLKSSVYLSQMVEHRRGSLRFGVQSEDSSLRDKQDAVIK
ncbi:hypothetical protein LTR78_009676 [Recurvomyces mirabilis]|uniref:Uncharacterized protein n=1 Tax=Recurvomyces mirabilis TaxID=574656 RepID=A0AAE0TR52_9PEZI|nr:hypothetical protein LTR78_009676 [Recurvomyces mirabilis]KAK5150282.1 hypothetical protein LTS14_010259 [Recurvomyces mirabilis]